MKLSFYFMAVKKFHMKLVFSRGFKNLLLIWVLKRDLKSGVFQVV